MLRIVANAPVLSQPEASHVLLIELAPCAPAGLAELAALVAAAGLPLRRAATVAAALELARQAPPALAILSVDGDAAPAALAQLAGMDVLVLAPDGAGAPPFPVAACYRAGAADVLGVSLLPVALAGKLASAVELAGSRLAHDGVDAARQALDASEERYRSLFAAVDEGVCVIEMIRDADGNAIDYRFLEINPAFVRHTGLADAVGKTILELVPDHDRSWMRLYGDIARTGEPRRYQNDSEGAMQRWFDVYATRIGGAGSDKVALLFSDISERRKAQLELQRLAADLTEANRRKNEFIATLAHELRNPLAPLRSGLPLLRMAGDDASARQRVLATMERQLGHLVELVDDLLDVGRINHGQIVLKNAIVDLADVASAAAEAARPAIEARRHQLLVDQQEGAGLLVYGDAIRLTQVISNLLNNAAKYTAAGGRLELRLRRSGAPADGGGGGGGEQALIEVRDNGAGIAAGDLEEVFTMFNQVARERFPGEGGLGIGLSLARNLAELHGGSLVAASAGPGQGSTFSVRLPLAPAPSARASTPAAMPTLEVAPAAAPAPASGHPVRVLVVDDNSDAADTLAELLELLGHTAQVANDGSSALEAMQDFRPQVVLLDLGMPVMNGYQVAEAIRNNRRFDQPLLAALTGWGGQHDRAQTRAAGFDLHLTKPVDLAVIVKVLASV